MCCKKDDDRGDCASRECTCDARREIVGLKSELRSFGHSVRRLEELATGIEPRQQPKEYSKM